MGALSLEGLKALRGDSGRLLFRGLLSSFSPQFIWRPRMIVGDLVLVIYDVLFDLVTKDL
ncbi:hypothetical protein CGLAR1_01165 [Corynebacterium glutamicum]|nr:hypothetical protein CGLAR1_01165 [Corynebacterium glutamicum]AIK86670.1 hypothetical protein AR0_01160 [Corynebacterium glutamicum]